MSDICIISATNNKNLELAKMFAAELEKNSQNYEIIQLAELKLPLYTPQAQAESIPPEIFRQIEKLDNAKALIWCAPEYNGGIPPVVTNFIAWISTCGDKDWRKCFNNKPAVIATFSGGGGMHLLNTLRLQLAYVGMNVLGRQIQANGKKPADPKSIKAIVEQLLTFTK